LCEELGQKKKLKKEKSCKPQAKGGGWPLKSGHKLDM